jgi:hypothetical protein
LVKLDVTCDSHLINNSNLKCIYTHKNKKISKTRRDKLIHSILVSCFLNYFIIFLLFILFFKHTNETALFCCRFRMANAKKPGPPATEPLLSTSISSAAHSSGTSCGTGIDLLSCSRDLQDRLAELRRRLTPKPFKCHFVDSLIYIIRLEHRNQTEFDEAIYSAYIQWSQLDYALNELKKIIKQKQAIRSLITKMQLHSRPNNHQTAIATAIQNNCSNSNSSLFDEYSDSSNGCPDKIELSCELDDLNTNNNDDLFSLVKILIRFLFKLIKLKVKNPSKETQVSTASIRLNKQLFNLKLILISCLADLFNFEDIKIQVSYFTIFSFYYC